MLTVILILISSALAATKAGHPIHARRAILNRIGLELTRIQADPFYFSLDGRHPACQAAFFYVIIVRGNTIPGG
jgi:hypothetical protein